MRVDDRVIHGQTMVRWFSEYPCDGLIIIDDQLAHNPVMANIYSDVVPSDIRVHVFDVNTAVVKMPQALESQKRYIVIFKSCLTLSKLLDLVQLPPSELNVGPSSKRPNTIEIIPTISLDSNEVQAYKKIAAKGFKVYFQIVPGMKKVWWQDAEKNHNL